MSDLLIFGVLDGPMDVLAPLSEDQHDLEVNSPGSSFIENHRASAAITAKAVRKDPVSPNRAHDFLKLLSKLQVQGPKLIELPRQIMSKRLVIALSRLLGSLDAPPT